MADNLLWMVREFYPGRKIIVWAHNVHVMKKLATITTSRSDSYEGMEMMGDHVWRELGNRVYILGATSYRGRFLRAGLDRLPNHIVRDQHPSIELEELLDAAAPDHAILDLRHRGPEGGWLDQPIMARLVEHVSERAMWSSIVDGLLFNRQMRPSTARPD